MPLRDEGVEIPVMNRKIRRVMFSGIQPFDLQNRNGWSQFQMSVETADAETAYLIREVLVGLATHLQARL